MYITIHVLSLKSSVDTMSLLSPSGNCTTVTPISSSCDIIKVGVASVHYYQSILQGYFYITIIS